MADNEPEATPTSPMDKYGAPVELPRFPTIIRDAPALNKPDTAEPQMPERKLAPPPKFPSMVDVGLSNAVDVAEANRKSDALLGPAANQSPAPQVDFAPNPPSASEPPMVAPSLMSDPSFSDLATRTESEAHMEADNSDTNLRKVDSALQSDGAPASPMASEYMSPASTTPKGDLLRGSSDVNSQNAPPANPLSNAPAPLSAAGSAKPDQPMATESRATDDEEDDDEAEYDSAEDNMTETTNTMRTDSVTKSVNETNSESDILPPSNTSTGFVRVHSEHIQETIERSAVEPGTGERAAKAAGEKEWSKEDQTELDRILREETAETGDSSWIGGAKLQPASAKEAAEDGFNVEYANPSLQPTSTLNSQAESTDGTNPLYSTSALRPATTTSSQAEATDGTNPLYSTSALRPATTTSSQAEATDGTNPLYSSVALRPASSKPVESSQSAKNDSDRAVNPLYSTEHLKPASSTQFGNASDDDDESDSTRRSSGVYGNLVLKPSGTTSSAVREAPVVSAHSQDANSGVLSEEARPSLKPAGSVAVEEVSSEAAQLPSGRTASTTDDMANSLSLAAPASADIDPVKTERGISDGDNSWIGGGVNLVQPSPVEKPDDPNQAALDIDASKKDPLRVAFEDDDEDEDEMESEQDKEVASDGEGGVADRAAQSAAIGGMSKDSGDEREDEEQEERGSVPALATDIPSRVSATASQMPEDEDEQPDWVRNRPSLKPASSVDSSGPAAAGLEDDKEDAEAQYSKMAASLRPVASTPINDDDTRVGEETTPSLVHSRSTDSRAIEDGQDTTEGEFDEGVVGEDHDDDDDSSGADLARAAAATAAAGAVGAASLGSRDSSKASSAMAAAHSQATSAVDNDWVKRDVGDTETDDAAEQANEMSADDEWIKRDLDADDEETASSSFVRESSGAYSVGSSARESDRMVDTAARASKLSMPDASQVETQTAPQRAVRRTMPSYMLPSVPVWSGEELRDPDDPIADEAVGVDDADRDVAARHEEMTAAGKTGKGVNGAHVNITRDFGLHGGHGIGVNDAAFLDAETVVTAGADGRICTWDIERRRVKHMFVPYEGEPVTMIHVVSSEDRSASSTIMTLSAKRLLRIWYTSSRRAVLLRSMQVPVTQNDLVMGVPFISDALKVRAEAAAQAAEEYDERTKLAQVAAEEYDERTKIAQVAAATAPTEMPNMEALADENVEETFATQNGGRVAAQAPKEPVLA